MKEHLKSMADNFRYLLHEMYLFRKGSIFLPVLGSIFRIFLSLITLWIPKLILDLIESRADYTDLLLWILVSSSGLLLMSVASALVHNRIDSYSQSFLFTRLKAGWEEKMIELDYDVFASHEGKVCAEKARNAIYSPNFGVVTYLGRVTGLLENAGGILALGSMIWVLQPLVLAGLLLLSGIELWAGELAEKHRHDLQEERAGANRKLNYMAYQTRGIREGKDIRIYSMREWLRGIARNAVAGKDRVEAQASRLDSGKMLLNGLLIFLRNGCAYGYFIWQYLQGNMTLGDFTLSFAAITGLGNYLGSLVQGYTAFREADYYVTDFRQFLELGQSGGRKKYNTDMIDGPVSFHWDHVSFSYWEEDGKGGRMEIPVLKNISLTIKAGEKLAIVGVNGAGKTTFVKLLCGLLKPGEGSISVNGMNLADFDGKDYRKLFSAVFQKSGLLPVSIRENITLDMDRDGRPGESKMIIGERTQKSGMEKNVWERIPGTENGIWNQGKDCDKDAVWTCIRLANLEEKVHSLPEGLDTQMVKQITENGTELSGGEQQRLLLARALYKDAPVLILDEPTAALDPIAENEIYQAYGRLTEGKTSVFISHRLASTRFCDRILVMEQGEITESGTHEELMKLNGRYAEMFRVQSEYYVPCT